MGYSEKNYSEGDKDGKDHDLGCDMCLKASPCKGRMKQMEEVATLKASKCLVFMGRN